MILEGSGGVGLSNTDSPLLSTDWHLLIEKKRPYIKFVLSSAHYTLQHNNIQLWNNNAKYFPPVWGEKEGSASANNGKLVTDLGVTTSDMI